MKITAKVKAGAKRDRVTPGEVFVVEVKAPPADGKANEALIKLVAGHFRVPRSAVSIKRGASSRNKVLEIVTKN